jgi:hypothetical protein
MKEILEIAKDISPIGIIAILAIIIWQLVKNSGVIGKIRGTQINDSDNVSNKEITDKIDLRTLNGKLDNLANNHLHELPRLIETVDRMEIKMNEQSERITRVETKLEFIIKEK